MEWGQPTNRSAALRHGSQSHGFAVRVWSNLWDRYLIWLWTSHYSMHQPSLRQCSNSQNNSFHVRKGNYLNMLSPLNLQVDNILFWWCAFLQYWKVWAQMAGKFLKRVSYARLLLGKKSIFVSGLKLCKSSCCCYGYYRHFIEER